MTSNAGMARSAYIGLEGKSTLIGWRLITMDGIEDTEASPSIPAAKNKDTLDESDLDVLTERG